MGCAGKRPPSSSCPAGGNLTRRLWRGIASSTREARATSQASAARANTASQVSTTNPTRTMKYATDDMVLSFVGNNLERDLLGQRGSIKEWAGRGRRAKGNCGVIPRSQSLRIHESMSASVVSFEKLAGRPVDENLRSQICAACIGTQSAGRSVTVRPM